MNLTNWRIFKEILISNLNCFVVLFAKTAKYLDKTLDVRLKWKMYLKNGREEVNIEFWKMYWSLLQDVNLE